MSELPKNYDPAAIEGPLFELWAEGGYFRRGTGRGPHADESYTIVIPPPNITGMLHMGHALNDTIQDACIRRARMQGYQTRWILGTDHAGIATQAKVDRHLAEQGISRREIGREKFIEACYDWRRDYGTTIVHQIKAMGCSCDYEDEQFTMSDEFSRAVRTVFCDWYHDGLIYRGKRIVNWCPSCTTAIADDEAEYEDEAGHLWYLRYPLKEPVGGRDYLVVATTRPETMLGDTGVAVSPKDEAAAPFVGKTAVLPLVNREIPVFSDFYVDAGFGTGFVKVTPAHDPNDFAMGQRHDLEKINIFDETAHVVEGYGRYSGMSREEAREAVLEDLEAQGLLDHVEDHDHSVMHCYRCHSTLEPWLSEQWFVAVDQLKEDAARVVVDGSISFHPARWKQVYLDWLDNLKDWCISRQLWWGHRIPMYYCDTCGWQDASVDTVEVCPQCGAAVRQDEDVLDTWFSSQLWPFATQGWGEYGAQAPELAAHYPTQVLSTARDITGLWVARMVMASEYCTGQIPFEDVIIHPTVMGADGKPMSKSRGNGVDPMELMADFGADGMRFGLLMQVTGAQAMKFNRSKLESSRNFATKIWNASRFVLMNLDDYVPGGPVPSTPADAWILSRLAAFSAAYDKALGAFEFGEAARLINSFIWNEFCDWYIELSKAPLQAGGDARLAAQRNLVFVLDQALRLLHPIMPYVTSEIWSRLPHGDDAETLMVASWPDIPALQSFVDPQAEHAIEMVVCIVTAVRASRARYGLSPKTDLAVFCKGDSSALGLDEQMKSLVCDLAQISDLVCAADICRKSGMMATRAAGLEILVDLEGHVDFEAETARLKKKQKELDTDLAKVEKKLSNSGYLAKAAPEVIAKDQAKAEELAASLATIREQLEEMS